MQTAHSLAQAVDGATGVSERMGRERLAVLRPSGGLAYWAGVEHVRRLIRSGCARPFGPKRRLDGCILYEGPKQPHAGTKYVHASEIAESWIDRDGIEHRRHPLEANVRGVYTFKRLVDAAGNSLGRSDFFPIADRIRSGAAQQPKPSD